MSTPENKSDIAKSLIQDIDSYIQQQTQPPRGGWLGKVVASFLKQLPFQKNAQNQQILAIERIVTDNPELLSNTSVTGKLKNLVDLSPSSTASQRISTTFLKTTTFNKLNAATTPQETNKLLAEFKRAHVNLRNEAGMTPLHLAVLKNNMRAVEQLLALGADPSIQDNNGNTPLHYAVQDGKSNVVAAISARSTRLEKKALVNSDGDTPWHILARQKGMQGSGVNQILQDLKKFGSSYQLISCDHNNEGLTPIHVAAKEMNVAMLSALFAPKQDQNWLHNISRIPRSIPEGKSPVHTLVENFTKNDHEQNERVALMIYFIASTHPEIFLIKDETEKTPLDYVLDLQKQGYDIPPEALYCLESPDKVKDLVEKEMDGVNAFLSDCTATIQKLDASKTTEERRQIDSIIAHVTPRSIAKPDLDVVDTVWKAAKEKTDAAGNNPWHNVASDTNCDPKALDVWLTPAYASKLKEKNGNGQTPLHVAIEAGNIQFFEALCDPTNRYNNVIDWHEEKDLLPHVLQKMNATTGREHETFKRMALLIAARAPFLAASCEEFKLGNPGELGIKREVAKTVAEYVHLSVTKQAAVSG